jgi:predicted nucleic acid-binding protein
VILLDTSGLLAAIDAAQRDHAKCAEVIAKSRGPFILSPIVLAELDYLLGTRVGSSAQQAFLGEVARGAYRLEPFGREDVAEASRVCARYEAHRIGIADASIVVLAGRHGARDVLTLDRRHFRALRRPNGRPFRLLPDDER